jgi:transglutaminase-like putative cysteine protease
MGGPQMTVFAVKHRTVFDYARPVGFGEHRILFRPRDSYDQRLIESTLAVEPTPREIRWFHDVFGNCVAVVSFAKRARQLVFESRIRIDHSPQSTPDFRIHKRAETYPFAYDGDDAADLGRLVERHYPDPQNEIGKWARRFVSAGPAGTDTGKLLMTLCFAIKESFNYSRRHEEGTQEPLVTLQSARGTCRDFALFMMEAVRSLGFASRFVTGYIYVPDRDGSEVLGGGSTHAWCQVYLPGAGWIEFDPTNGIVGNRDLIRVAVVRDPRQAVPLSGTYAGKAGDAKGMTVQVNVTTETSSQPGDTTPDTSTPHRRKAGA